jgi:hypothetical protein
VALKPSDPRPVSPGRPPAAHLQAAVAQAKALAGSFSLRPAAAHVRIAVAAVQAKPSGVTRPAPPVAQARTTVRAVQAKLPIASPVIQMARIRELIQSLIEAGFKHKGQKTSHHHYAKGTVHVSLAYHTEADEAKPYQEKEVQEAIERAAGGGAAAAEEEEDERKLAPILSAYDDPRTTRESRALIARGLAEGCYPPRRS